MLCVCCVLLHLVIGDVYSVLQLRLFLHNTQLSVIATLVIDNTNTHHPLQRLPHTHSQRLPPHTHTHHNVCPPSITRLCPVIFLDASDAKNTTAACRSVASARHLVGIRVSHPSTSGARAGESCVLVCVCGGWGLVWWVGGVLYKVCNREGNGLSWLHTCVVWTAQTHASGQDIAAVNTC